MTFDERSDFFPKAAVSVTVADVRAQVEAELRTFADLLVAAAPSLANGTTISWNVTEPTVSVSTYNGVCVGSALRVLVTWDASLRGITYNDTLPGCDYGRDYDSD
jgi:hypothetical protein